MKNKIYTFLQYIKQIFIYPPLVISDVDYDEYWKDKRGENLGDLSDWQKIRADFVTDSLKGKEKSSFVDIGCGDGSILNYLKNKGVIYKGTGIDMSDFALGQVRSFGFESIKEDITGQNFTNRIPEADYAILFEILEHIPHSEKMLSSVFDKSKKGVFFSFPNTGFIVHRLRLLFGKFPLQWRLSPGEHVRFWTKMDLLWWLNNLGYKNYKVFYYKGVPVLNKIWPSLFAAAFVVFLKK